jgi:superfamily II DNA/RNA helicase
MLDLGFLPDVETIIAATPDHRQTMLFSATMPKAVVALARRYAKRPTFVHAEPEGEQATVPATRQLFFQVHPLNRFQVLCRILDAPDRDRVAVFRRTKRGVDRTIKGLVDEGYRAGALHGDMPQVTREQVMRQFRKGKLDVLVCTDVASRGLDIAGLSHVINYDTPEDDRAYVHRIGRTGRAGAAGVAVTFVAWNELDTADLIRRRLELTDEPVHEVYSTSPLLSELFDLPSVEEAAAAERGTLEEGDDAVGLVSAGHPFEVLADPDITPEEEQASEEDDDEEPALEPSLASTSSATTGPGSPATEVPSTAPTTKSNAHQVRCRASSCPCRAPPGRAATTFAQPSSRKASRSALNCSCGWRTDRAGAGIHLQDRVPDQLDGSPGRSVDGHDLVVVAMDDQGWCRHRGCRPRALLKAQPRRHSGAAGDKWG